MAEQAPERLPGAVVPVATGAQLAEYELAGVERGHGVQARRHWLAWLLWLLAGCSWLLGWRFLALIGAWSWTSPPSTASPRAFITSLYRACQKTRTGLSKAVRGGEG